MSPEDFSIPPKTDPHSPFHSRIPQSSAQTETLGKRFELWRHVLKSLIHYFRAIVAANEQFSLVNNNVANSFDFPFFTSVNAASAERSGGKSLILMEPKPENIKKGSFFSKFGEGSIQDVQVLLKKYHLNLALHQRKLAVELSSVIIPRLEELQKDLVIKVREIKNLSSDFKDNNSINTEIALTGQLLDDYIDAMTNLEEKGDCQKDPYLYRLALEAQLNHQLHVENHLEEAFMNLQITALMLEKIIYKELQTSLDQYSELISQEIFIHYNDLINELHLGIISKKPYFEWDSFIERDNGKTFLKVKHNDKLSKPKKITDLTYPFNRSMISKTIRSGHLLKKSKILKSYSKSFFILTLNYLHEFKSSKLDGSHLTPVHSIKLNDAILVDSNNSKFKLSVATKNTEQKMVSSTTHVFKNADLPEAEFQKWVHDIKTLTSFNSFTERYGYISSKLNHIPRPALTKTSSASTSSNQLRPVSSANYFSRAQTPNLELNNPMDLAAINSKLESIQINNHDNDADTPSSVSTNEIQRSSEFPFPQNPLPELKLPARKKDTTLAKITTTESDHPNIPVETRPSKGGHLKPGIPTLDIQRPTPTRPNAPILPDVAVPQHHNDSKPTSILKKNGLSTIGFDSNDSLKTHRKEGSSDSETNYPRSATPLIGEPTRTNNTGDADKLGMTREDIDKKIHLNQSLYDENGHQVDLSELLKKGT